MRVFLTGATGFIGSAIVRELLGAGHQVLGLARNDAAAGKLAQASVEAHRGDLSDPASLAAGAQTCDGVIHTAFGHDFSKYLEAGETDRRAIEAMVQAMEGSGKPLVITSVTVIVAPGTQATEVDPALPDSPSGIRAPSEQAVLAAARRGVRGVVLRLPPTVHGEGDHGFVPALIGVARRTGISAFVGDGSNRWPAVHRLDAALLFRLAVETATAGTRLHGAAEEGIPMREIAEAIGQGLGLPVCSLGTDEADAHFDWLARFVPIDNPTSSAITRSAVGWTPRQAGLLADMHESKYFA